MSTGPTDEELEAMIVTLWLKAKPSRKAQEIRAALSVSFDDPRFNQWAGDFCPDYIWYLVDIAAQQGIAQGRAEMQDHLAAQSRSSRRRRGGGDKT